MKLKQPCKIGLIATGDELTQGDILNTNGQYIAENLQALGFLVQQHIIVDDDETRISQAVQIQLQENDIIIISGGLGPTSDDRTRFALAKAIDRPLIFDEATWQQIYQRLQRTSRTIDQHNRQQALFPEQAEILPNPHGSAAGCSIKLATKQIFMLPGPPNECLPMFREYVLSTLKSQVQPTFNFKWLLLGASEGEIAGKLDAAVAHLNCKTGYRWAYPYLEFKVFADNQTTLNEATTKCEILLKPYLISKKQQTAKQQIQALISEQNITLHFSSQPLAQLVKFALLTAHNHHHLSASKEKATLTLNISGLAAYWQQQQTPTMSEIILEFSTAQKQNQKKLSIYYRDEQVKEYLVELICRELLIYFDAL